MGREVTLFVYGTLLRGEESHALVAPGRFDGEARTLPKYALVDLGTYPGMVRGGDVSVLGELWTVDLPTLAAIDVHEGHPVLFKRSLVDLQDREATPVEGSGRREVEAYLLDFDQVRGRRRIRGGAWKDRAATASNVGVGPRDAPLLRWTRGRTR